jgi:hypothetical protein
MKHATFVRAMRPFVRRRPFQTYFVELHGGLIISVRHPEALSLRGELALYVSTLNEHTFFDSTCVSRVFEEHAGPPPPPSEQQAG